MPRCTSAIALRCCRRLARLMPSSAIRPMELDSKRGPAALGCIRVAASVSTSSPETKRPLIQRPYSLGRAPYSALIISTPAFLMVAHFTLGISPVASGRTIATVMLNIFGFHGHVKARSFDTFGKVFCKTEKKALRSFILCKSPSLSWGGVLGSFLTQTQYSTHTWDQVRPALPPSDLGASSLALR